MSNLLANMMILVLWAFLGMASSTVASSSSPSATTSSTAPPTTHSVIVGVGGFSYSPNSIQANVGDTIQFEFTSGNHSVGRAEYGYPCIPYEDTGPGKVGFWSRFQPYEGVPENSPVWRLRVNGTEPIFFYCSAPGACVLHAMIGVINPNSTRSLASQANFITASTIQYSPGESPPSESSTPTSTPTPTPSNTNSSSSSSTLSSGAIAGIVIGVVAVVVLAGVALYLCGRNRSLTDTIRYSGPRTPRPDTIPTIPLSEPRAGNPYSPSFSPKIGHASQDPNAHYSWQTQGYPGGYNAFDNPSVSQNHEMSTDTSILSPGLGSPGLLSDGSSFMVQSQRSPDPVPNGPHELDARSSVPDAPGAAPPEYIGRPFSFNQEGDAAPGVKKALGD